MNVVELAAGQGGRKSESSTVSSVTRPQVMMSAVLA